MAAVHATTLAAMRATAAGNTLTSVSPKRDSPLLFALFGAGHTKADRASTLDVSEAPLRVK